MKRSEAMVAKIRRQLPPVAMKALQHLESLADGSHPGAHETKETRQDKAARVFLTGFLAAERAREQANTPQQPGAIVVYARLEDTAQNRLSWEQEAAQLGGTVIEAAALPAKEPIGS